MKFIINTKNKLIATYKLSAFSCKLSAFRKLSAKSYQLKAIPEANSYKLKANQGFTLIETLVAISILMVAVASPLTIAQKGLASAIYAKDQIIASYLAQDAIEYIINLSGKNIADGAGWLDGIKVPCASSCIVDTSAGSITSCSSSCLVLKYNDVSRIYSYASGGNSPFTRTVKVEEGPANEALITITMSWKDKGTTRTLLFYTRIYNWKS